MICSEGNWLGKGFRDIVVFRQTYVKSVGVANRLFHGVYCSELEPNHELTAPDNVIISLCIGESSRETLLGSR